MFPAGIGAASAANFSHLLLGMLLGVSALVQKPFVPHKAALSFFYTFKSLSMIPGSKYSIIQAKLFVNS